jgi:hypothetical protein
VVRLGGGDAADLMPVALDDALADAERRHPADRQSVNRMARTTARSYLCLCAQAARTEERPTAPGRWRH